MNEERRRAATSYIIFGLILYLIGAFDYRISHLIRDFNDDIRIYGWGWIPQLIGGILAIYGFMIFLEEFLGFIKQRYHGLPLPPPLTLVLLMDKEMKKVIWFLLIVALIICILSPGLPCIFILIFLLILVFIIIILLFISYEQVYHFLNPPPHYLPPPQIPYKSPPAHPKTYRTRSCKHCHTQLQPNWIVCPICGESVSDKN